MATNEKTEKRNRNWAFVMYPDSALEDWKKRLESFHVPVLISPLHDADLNGDETEKKPHWHVMVMFETLKAREQAQELADSVNATRCISVSSKQAMARYMCHLDNPEKHQYEPVQVMALGGADYDAVCGCMYNRTQVVGEMIEYIKKNQLYSFSDFVAWTKDNNETWFRSLISDSSYIITNFMQSMYWTDTKLKIAPIREMQVTSEKMRERISEQRERIEELETKVAEAKERLKTMEEYLPWENDEGEE